MSIEKQEWESLRQILVTLLRETGELRAGEQAMQRVWLDLARHWGDSEATSILGKYDAYKSERLVDALLELEKRFPSLAAELDKQRPLISPSEPDEP
jgi:hypothetical protein